MVEFGVELASPEVESEAGGVVEDDDRVVVVPEVVVGVSLVVVVVGVSLVVEVIGGAVGGITSHPISLQPSS